MENQVTQWTLLTYPGIAAVVVMMVGGAKKLWASWISGKEPHLSLALTLVLGVVSKVSISGAFAGIHWVTHIVALVGTAFTAKVIHDWLVNEVVKGEEKKV